MSSGAPRSNPVQMVEIGAVVEKTFEVTREMCTARGDALILSSPQLIFLMERTARELAGQQLPDTQDTVGVSVMFEHRAPTLQGMQVRIEGRVDGQEGRFVDFDLIAHDDLDEIAVMKHRRVLIDLARYQHRLADKQARWQGDA